MSGEARSGPRGTSLLVGTHKVQTSERPRVGIDYLGISTPVVRREIHPGLWDTIQGGGSCPQAASQPAERALLFRPS